MYKDPSLQYLFEIINRHQHENTKFFTKKAKFCYLKYFVLFSLLILKNYYMLLFVFLCLYARRYTQNGQNGNISLSRFNLNYYGKHCSSKTENKRLVRYTNALHFICRLSSTITTLTISITKCERLFPRYAHTPNPSKKKMQSIKRNVSNYVEYLFHIFATAS